MREVAPLAGYMVAVTAARRRREFGAALERRGARVVYGPAIRIVPLTDDAELFSATNRCLAEPLDLVVATTGIGFRGWMDAAETWGLGMPLTAALRKATILARGPKVCGAVRAAGLREQWSPESESTTEVLHHLLAQRELAGRRVAVQLHGEPLNELTETLRAHGAEVIEVPVYRWVPPQDEQPLRRVIEATAAAAIDCLTFTSAPAVVNLLQTADLMGLSTQLHAALTGPVLAAAVGPVCAGPLQRVGIPVVQPTRYRLGALVREVVLRLPARAQVIELDGHRLELRGHAAVVDDQLVPLPATAMTLLAALARRPGAVVSRDELGSTLPGERDDGHAVEDAIGRLRMSLGDPTMIRTVVKRGYRLAAIAN